MSNIYENYEKLKVYIKKCGKAAIAFSAGVDSTFLLSVACETIGSSNVLAITASLNSVPKRELEEGRDFCKSLGVRLVELSLDELKIEGFSENPKNRCYICKKSIFTEIIKTARENGFEHVFEGSNLDDMGDYRPGMQAIKELLVESPLKESGLSKSEIRALSKELNLKTWNKPSFACLSSRIAYGETISYEKLNMVEKAEQLLLDKGFTQFRVRVHGNSNIIGRIEVLPEEFEKMLDDELRSEIYDKLKALGFAYVALDLAGYRTGSMNEVLKNI